MLFFVSPHAPEGQALDFLQRKDVSFLLCQSCVDVGGALTAGKFPPFFAFRHSQHHQVPTIHVFPHRLHPFSLFKKWTLPSFGGFGRVLSSKHWVILGVSPGSQW